MVKTNQGLVNHVEAILKTPTIYMLSGFGRKLNGPVKSWHHSVDHRVFTLKCTHTIANEARIRAGIGRYCYDCVGLIKNYLWFNPEKEFPYSIEYNNPVGSDQNCNGMYMSATQKGLFATMPDVPGTLVFIHDGASFTHVGVYVGRNSLGAREYIEATPSFGFWGVGRSNDTMRKWTHWGWHHLIEYTVPPKPPVLTAKTYTIVKGDTLSRIGTKVNIPWQELYELNKDIIGPDYNKIEVGQVLRLDPNVVFVEKEVIKEVEKIIPIDAKFTDGVVEVVVKTL